MYVQFEPGFAYPKELQELGIEAAEFVSYVTGVPVDEGGNVDGWTDGREPLAEAVIALADWLYGVESCRGAEGEKMLIRLLRRFADLADPPERTNLSSV
jgi:hypothetical protein